MNVEERYAFSLRALHWLVFVAVLVAVAAIELHDLLPKGSAARDAIYMVHQSAGLTVLALTVLRVGARVAATVPAPVPGSKALQRVAVHTHGALYLLMIGMPILGILAVVWSGDPLEVFGTTLALPVAERDALSHIAKEAHEAGANLVYIFVGLHSGAALWHAFVVKDGVLRRML
ncbi:cytochrome b [Cupriavidus pauculus]|uniref:cytochrome b n=1 Tax=Cupriavidus pauculus TaxID=82633 RepID=UPI000785606C|nr:cytochrome b [Cupriavidus pauculus]